MFDVMMGRVSEVDIHVMNWFSTIRDPGLFEFFRIATYAGSIFFTLLFLLVFSVFLYFRNQVKYALFLVFSYVGAEVTTWAIKYIIARPRPKVIGGVSELNPSFPSGHATAVTSILLFIAYYYIKNSDLRFRKLYYISFSLSLIVFILFSRLYLNLHYLSDVTAGFLVGSMWAAIACLLCEKEHLSARMRGAANK